VTYVIQYILPSIQPPIDTAVWNDRVVASTGQRLLIFETEDLGGGKLFMKPYPAVLDRLHGWLSFLKRGL
jgi:hypothetical protein